MHPSVSRRARRAPVRACFDGPVPIPARTGATALVLAALVACSSSPLEACVRHSVEEGVDRRVAEQACRDAGRGD